MKKKPSQGFSDSAAAHLLSFALAWGGSALSLVWIQSEIDALWIAPLAFLLAAFWWTGFGAGDRAAPVWLRWPARLLSAGHVLLIIYLLVAFGSVLAWTVPLWLWAGVFVLAVAAGLSWTGVLPLRVPAILPLGFVLAGCLAGWWREDGAIRCDDYARVLQEPDVSIALASSPELSQCRPGEVLRVRRYPRRVWESPAHDRLVVTTQQGIDKLRAVGRPVPGPFSGSICEVRPNTPQSVPCVEPEGKAQLILEDDQRQRLFVPVWSLPSPEQRAVLYELPLAGPFRVLRRLPFKGNVQEGYMDPALDVIALTSDEGDGLHAVRASTMQPLPLVPVAVIPDEVRYDRSTKKGVFCGGDMSSSGLAASAIGFEGWPPAPHPIGAWRLSRPLSLTMSWGCDWDEQARRVYVAVANLGTIDVLDYDTGVLLKRYFAGFGTRAVLLDRSRHALYVANFLRGDVEALDLETGAELHHWFVGRFVRNLSFSRDGTFLWATSTVGVLRIALDAPR